MIQTRVQGIRLIRKKRVFSPTMKAFGCFLAKTGQEWTPNRGITDNGHQTPVQEWEGGRTRDLLSLGDQVKGGYEGECDCVCIE